MLVTQKEIERFWSNVRIGRTDECWPWLASLGSAGYGQFRTGSRTLGDRKVVRTHEVVFSIAHGFGPLEELRHTCGNRPCCNPAHIRDSSQDEGAVLHEHLGRTPRKVPNPELVFQLKRQGFRQVDIAQQLGLTQQYVSHILLLKRRVPGAAVRP